MIEEEPDQLRILIADGRRERLEEVTRAVASLGHETISRETDLANLGEVSSAVRPDVTIVIVGESSERSLELIRKVVKEAASPVIALLDVEDPAFVREAAKRGVFAYIAGGGAAELQSSFDVVLRRFAEYHNLEGAIGRRAVTERAKGILMERHHVYEDQAFSMLRAEARRTARKVVAVAEAVVVGHQLLPGRQVQGAEPAEESRS